MMQRGVVALVDLDNGDASLMISRHVEQRLAWSMMWMRLFLALSGDARCTYGLSVILTAIVYFPIALKE